MTKASWEDLKQTASRTLPDSHISNILKRIGETPDGVLLRKWLHDHRLMTAVSANAPESALRDDAAERRIALRLYTRLERKIADGKPITS